MECKTRIGTAVLWGLLSSPVWAVSNRQPIVSVSPSGISTSSNVAVSSDVWRQVPNTAFQAGEDLFFVIRWGVLTGGHSTLAVHGIDRINDRPAYHIVEDTHSSGFVDTFYPVHDRNDAWLDTESMTTLHYEKRIREGRYRIEQIVQLDQVNHRYRVDSHRFDKGTTEFMEGDLTPNVLDVLGSLYYVRTLPLEVGQTYSIDVYDGGKVWPLVVNIKKRVKVSVPAGKFDCFIVEPLLREPGIFVSKGKKLEVWLTADKYHMPVLMRSEIIIGHVSAELVSYHRLNDLPSATP
jgi:hypothetical protein